MAALAESSAEKATPEFLILTDLPRGHALWPSALAQVDVIRAACAPVLGFEPCVRLVCAAEMPVREGVETFVLPAALDFSLWEREELGRKIAEARRGHPKNLIFHDDIDPGHPLLVDALVGQASACLAGQAKACPTCGLVFAASGHGDSASRAQSYRLMRLIWEQAGFARAEVGFLRHVQPFLAHVLERCAREPIPWVVLFQGQWETEHVEYARVMVENVRRANPQPQIHFADPPGAHELFTAWYAQRIAKLWRERRARSEARAPSPKRSAPEPPGLLRFGAGTIARVSDQARMSRVLEQVLPPAKPDRILVKVTWHGYATGTYTDPAALDLLLSALPAPAIVLEGHTSSRNLGGAEFDWETEARENRAWIRRQEAEYLRRTGLQEVLTRHRAQYVNVTEEFWNEEYEGDPANFVPSVLRELKGSPMLNFPKFKGPTRLAVSNMFGLIPLPLRSAWHGPNITWFARACCNMAKLYSELFELSAVVEGLYSAVRWNRQGLYRSRWGNYDLIHDAGCVTASPGLAAADILAARLQGQNVHTSAFFDVVRQELGWDEEAATAELPEVLRMLFV
ncbi:MAG: hypothetical protein JO307_31380 [Bryobacterales bacterium]|nr:hypothetical protein [Bryobacterales bacterium]MBV9397218.1 hypothetical protein [Bryobacterales bacterium]